MPFIKELNKDFFIKDNKIILSEDYMKKNQWKFKKITGSRFSSVLGENEWNTEVKTWAIMVGIFKERMDETLSFVGNIIEPKIKKYVEETLNQEYMSYVPMKIQWDIFKSNMIFGGIPDGEPIKSNGEFNYPNARMLEIKTTAIDSLVFRKIDNVLTMQKDSNNIPLIKEKNGGFKKWFNFDGSMKASNDYCMQLSLYLYLRNIEKGLFAVAFLKVEDYSNPQKYDPYNSKINFLELNLDRKLFEEKIIYATHWYTKYIKVGESPTISSKDSKWLKEEGLT